MPRKTRRQLVGKQEDAERMEREASLLALERELHQEQTEKMDDFLPMITEPVEMVAALFKAKIKPLTVHM
jgi:hypothetical protein